MSKSAYFLLIFIIGTMVGTGCTGSDGLLDETGEAVEDFDAALVLIDTYGQQRAKTCWDTAGTMPDDDCQKLMLRYPGPPLRKLFNDSNYMHYGAAEELGIHPIVDENFARDIKRPLELVASDRYIYIDSLRYSYPYLVPEAHALLKEIGQRFHDTLAARGGGNYRIKVTSLLRTPNSISKLRRVNRASVDSSAHLFGTTFDISFKNFPYHGGTPHRTQEDLKNLLAEILHDLRTSDRCYVKYEHKQGCFHITTRPFPSKN